MVQVITDDCIPDAPTIVLELDMDKEVESIDMYKKALTERMLIKRGDFSYFVLSMNYERGLGIAVCTITLKGHGRRPDEKDTTR
jgi:hypothetical protein